MCSLSLLPLGTVGCALRGSDSQTCSATNPGGVGEGRLEAGLASEQEMLLPVVIPQKSFVVSWDEPPEGSASTMLVEDAGVPQDPEFPGQFGGRLATTSAGVRNQNMLDRPSAPMERIKDDFTLGSRVDRG